MPSAFAYHCRAGPRSEVLTWYGAVRKPKSKAMRPFFCVLWTTATADIETTVIRTAAVQILMPTVLAVLCLKYWRNGNRIRIVVDRLVPRSKRTISAQRQPSLVRACFSAERASRLAAAIKATLMGDRVAPPGDASWN